MLDMEGCAESPLLFYFYFAYASKHFSIEVMHTTIG